MGLTTKGLERAMVQLLCRPECEGTKMRFLGVFPFDLFPLSEMLTYFSTPYDSCCIVNIDPGSQPGKHWVCFFLLNAQRQRTPCLDFFDSYANPPAYYSFPIPPTLTHNIRFNPFRMQSNHSSVCGQYCSVFLFFRVTTSKRMITNLLSGKECPFHSLCTEIHGLATSLSTRDVKIEKLFRGLLAGAPRLSLSSPLSLHFSQLKPITAIQISRPQTFESDSILGGK